MTIDKTVTSIFMVATLSISKEELNRNGFINAYADDELHTIKYPQGEVVFVLLKPSDFSKFNEFLNKEYERNNVLEDYDYEGGYVVIVYSLNKDFKKDFDLIREGKYSKTSKQFQKLFTENIQLNGKIEKSLQYRVFNKTEDLIAYWNERVGEALPLGHELWEMYDLQKETLNINNIKQLLNNE